jgi:hypothetical protein
MSGNFNLKAIISAVDKVSPVLRGISRNVRSFSRQFEQAGRGAPAMAAGLGAAVLIPARAFMELEDASVALKNSLMTGDGLVPGFAELSKIAVDLGNKLPGTTADFAHMATVMHANGLAVSSMVNGGLKATAFLATATQGLGETYDSAALGITKISNVFNVADKDFMALADTMQRVVNIGVGIEPFTSAMSKAGGVAKALGVDGLAAAKSFAPLVALLVRSGVDPSEAGTGLKKIVSVFGGAGKFKNVEGLVASLEKMYKQKPEKLIALFKELFGEEHGGKALIIAAGGYAKITEEMKKQAALDMRVNESLKTLGNLWGAATGTFTNAMAAFAEAYAPQLKELADSFNSFSAKLFEWSKNNAGTIGTVLKMAGAFVGLKMAFYGIGIALAFVSKMMLMTPFGLFLNAASIAVPLIIAYWDEIKAFALGVFGKLESGTKNTVNIVLAAWDNLKGGIMLGIEAFTTAFPAIGETIKAVFGDAIDWVMGKWTAFIASISNVAQSIGSFVGGVVDDFGGNNVGGMTLPGQEIQRKPIVSKQSIGGVLDINHNNAPQGFRAAQPKTRGPFRINQNVGYNWTVTGN